MSDDKQNPRIWMMPTAVKTYDHLGQSADQYVTVGLNNSTDVLYDTTRRKIKIRPHVELSAAHPVINTVVSSYDSGMMSVPFSTTQYIAPVITVSGGAQKITFGSIVINGAYYHVHWINPSSYMTCRANYLVELLRGSNVVKTYYAANLLWPNEYVALTNWSYGFSQGENDVSNFYMRVTMSLGDVIEQHDYIPGQSESFSGLQIIYSNVTVTKPPILVAFDGKVNYAVVANYIISG
ncbi:MAG: hypothetical protein Q4D58_08795 [Synergistaceae bacterium]|nr:hypothetical protein [Synergistaceae bacterium]